MAKILQPIHQLTDQSDRPMKQNFPNNEQGQVCVPPVEPPAVKNSGPESVHQRIANFMISFHGVKKNDIVEVAEFLVGNIRRSASYVAHLHEPNSFALIKAGVLVVDFVAGEGHAQRDSLVDLLVLE